MGRYPRRKQRRLGAKLREIRETFKLSQNEILWRLGLDEEFTRTNISNYEQDHREPPLYVLLQYARLAGVCLDAIVDDDVDLPKRLPTTPKHRGVKSSAGRLRSAKR